MVIEIGVSMWRVWYHVMLSSVAFGNKNGTNELKLFMIFIIAKTQYKATLDQQERRCAVIKSVLDCWCCTIVDECRVMRLSTDCTSILVNHFHHIKAGIGALQTNKACMYDYLVQA